MKWLLRPSVIVTILVALVVVAVAVMQGMPVSARPVPLPVTGKDREIVWLYPATNAAAWERFVTSVGRAAKRLRDDHPGLEAHVGPTAFPTQTTSVPEVALAWPDQGPRLVFRWYKLTSDWKSRDWVEALARRRPPPLAVIGGSNSDAARDLAGQLRRVAATLAEADQPLLLLTTGTADRIVENAGPEAPGAERGTSPGEELSRLYEGRTYRFCFTNRQMAMAVTDFIWSQADLRPDTDPVHLVRWEDDAYSPDLIDGFWQSLHLLVAREAGLDLAWALGGSAHGGVPPGLAGGILPLHRAGANGSGFFTAIPTIPQVIDSSVGGFEFPNRFEAQAANYLVLDLKRYPEQRRPLLVVTGQAQPTRRFLRALERAAPDSARRFVVATGDALPFNTVYRDRQVAWPIQDMPFSLVFFCHHNPVDPDAGFRPEEGEDRAPTGHAERPPRPGATTSTGTEDVLLFGDVVEALAQAFRLGGLPCADATELGSRLGALRLRDSRIRPGPEGQPLFTGEGNRRTGTGEHVVCLRPLYEGELILPRATIEVWAWRPASDGYPDPAGGTVTAQGPWSSHYWRRYGDKLPVRYDEAAGEGGTDHGPD